jgi:hypothetical protein
MAAMVSNSFIQVFLHLDFLGKIWYNKHGAKAPFGVTASAAIAPVYERFGSIYLPLTCKGGDAMAYVTWGDLLQIALIVFTIISCFYNKKR